MKLMATVFAAVIGMALPCGALGFPETYLMQSTLNEHGYNAGEPDGKVGAATREAIQEFAAVYGGPRDVDGAFNYMIKLSVAARVPVKDSAQLEIITAGVSQNMRDPDSVKIRDVYTVTDVDHPIVCGEVNGKNVYGGYAGYQHFVGMMAMGKFIPIRIDEGDPPSAMITCALAFPRLDPSP